jgi:outer membrane immunogenic protein
MKTLQAAIVAAVSLLVAAGAAERPLATLYKAPPAPAAVVGWSGFYAGANVGYGRDKGASSFSEDTTDPATFGGFLSAIVAAGEFPATFSPPTGGMIGGGQLGYNWMLAPRWLLGLETDLQASGIRGSSGTVLQPMFFDASETDFAKRLDWFGTLRARLGVLATPGVLLYATGGLAYGRTEVSFSNTDVTSGCSPGAMLCSAGSASGVHAGWTVGAGVEAMVAANWSVKAEYLYLDLGSRSVTAFATPAFDFGASTDFHEHIGRVGFNYHID